MALAPLSQTLLLTEDGTALDVGSPVTIPPRPVVPLPSFAVPASIGSDGTPQVGERLVGDPGEPVDGVIIAVAWLRAGTVLSEEIAYTPLQIGDLDFRSTARGPGGTTTSAATVSVAPASVTPPTPISISGTPPTSGTVGEAYSFIPNVSGGSGTRTFALASGVLLGGMSFSTTTGRIDGPPNVAGTISDLSIRVTDSTGSDETDPVDVTIAAAPVTYTLDNTNDDITLAGTAVQGWAARYLAIRTRLAALGQTVTGDTSQPIATLWAELRAARANIEGGSTPQLRVVSIADASGAEGTGTTPALRVVSIADATAAEGTSSTLRIVSIADASASEG